MQFDETSPKKRNSKQQITSHNATKNRPTGNTALYFGKSILNELGCRTHDQSRGTSVSLLWDNTTLTRVMGNVILADMLLSLAWCSRC